VRTPEQILEDFTVVAVVGASTDPSKASHLVPATLRKHGFRIMPVNPRYPRIIGETAYPALSDIPFPVEVVEVFRPAEEAADIARQAVAVGAKALWLQVGISSPEARQIAQDAGLDYVEDACMAVLRAQHGIEHPAGSTT
jgi:uncharacterized protein